MSTASKWADLGERAAWTLVQAGVGEEIVQLVSGPQWLVPLLALALSGIKSALAQRFGSGTAATLPASLEAPPQTPATPAVTATTTAPGSTGINTATPTPADPPAAS